MKLAASLLLTSLTCAAQFGQIPGASGGSGTPGGSNGQLQYNNAGAFGGCPNLNTTGNVLTAVSGGCPVAVNSIPATVGVPSAYTVTPEQFGAIGDCSTNDSAAFAAAIAAIPAQGGLIQMASKCYKANVIINKSWVHLKGQGRSEADPGFYAVSNKGTTITPNSVGSPAVQIRSGTSAASLSGVQLTDFAVVGVSITDGSVGIDWSQSDTSVDANSGLMDGVSIIQLQTCLNEVNTDGVEFINGTIYECGQIANLSNTGLSQFMSDILYDSLAGIFVSSSTGFNLTSSPGMGRNGAYDVQLHNSTNSVVVGNTFVNNNASVGKPFQTQTVYSVIIDGSTFTTITGNSWTTTATSGIGAIGNFSNAIIYEENSSSFATITGNTMGQSNLGILLHQGSYNVVSGNFCYGGSTSCLQVDSLSGSNAIGSNVLFGSVVNNSSTITGMYSSPISNLTGLGNSGGSTITLATLSNTGSGANTAGKIQWLLGGSSYGSINDIAASTDGLGNRMDLDPGGGAVLLLHSGGAAGITKGMVHGPMTFAQITALSSPVNGTLIYCSDCKNFTDDTTGTFDSAIANSGHGTNALYENGAWRVH